MDLGSALVASVPATVAFALAITLAVARERRALDLLGRLGARLAADPYAALAAGAVVLLALGAVEALGLAAVWGLTGWPIAPLQGALMGLGQSALLLVVPRLRTRRRWLPLLAGVVTFGAAMGLVYSPGI